MYLTPPLSKKKNAGAEGSFRRQISRPEREREKIKANIKTMYRSCSCSRKGKSERERESKKVGLRCLVGPWSLLLQVKKMSSPLSRRVLARLSRKLQAPAAAAGRSLGVAASSSSSSSAMPVAKYGGRHTVTMMPGDGIGPEMMAHVREVLRVAGAPVDFETVRLDPAADHYDDLRNVSQEEACMLLT